MSESSPTTLDELEQIQSQRRMYVVMATWDDAPHLTPEMKADFLSKIPPNERDARARGLPSMGKGLVYTTPVESVRIEPFKIPPHYKRVYALDTGWNWNSVVWGAWDTTTDIVYIYDVVKLSKAEPAIVATTIKSRGEWIPGIADAADVDRNQGVQYIQTYRDLGLDLELPIKGIEAGITAVWHRFSTGRLRVFSHCHAWFDEYQFYSRGKNGKIKDGQDDHLLDATQYLITTGLGRATLPTGIVDEQQDKESRRQRAVYSGELGWMG